MAKRLYRYVEVCSKDSKHWRGVLPTDPVTGREAVEIATSEAANAWGIPTYEVEVFVMRRLTEQKHAMLLHKMNHGDFDPDWWMARRAGASF